MPMSTLAERTVQHYQAEKPESKKAAMKSVKEGIASVKQLLKVKDPTAEQIEKVHEITYQLEAAVEVLSEEAKNSEKYDELAASIEELYLSSEQGEIEQARESLKKVKAAFKGHRSGKKGKG